MPGGQSKLRCYPRRICQKKTQCNPCRQCAGHRCTSKRAGDGLSGAREQCRSKIEGSFRPPQASGQWECGQDTDGLDSSAWQSLYIDCAVLMRKMLTLHVLLLSVLNEAKLFPVRTVDGRMQQCRLVHGDLSEYNMPEPWQASRVCRPSVLTGPVSLPLSASVQVGFLTSICFGTVFGVPDLYFATLTIDPYS